MFTEYKIATAHQALGEFVVDFQWIENLYRQIGWFILDPERKDWPPTKLRHETNCQLIDKVTDMFVSLTQAYAFPNGDEKAKDILELKDHFHELRRYRNRLHHSTYVELKSNGEVHGYIRSNRGVSVGSETGELIFDQEDFTAEAIYSKIHEYSDYMLRLHFLHVQLIHWTPFARHGSKAAA